MAAINVRPNEIPKRPDESSLAYCKRFLRFIINRIENPQMGPVLNFDDDDFTQSATKSRTRCGQLMDSYLTHYLPLPKPEESDDRELYMRKTALRWLNSLEPISDRD